jgi:hypothetical protein
VGKQVGETRRDRKGEVEDEEDNEEEESEDDKNDIVIRNKDKFKGHSQGGYFTERRRFLGRGRRKENEKST